MTSARAALAGSEGFVTPGPGSSPWDGYRRDERGAVVSLWWLIVAAGTLTVLLGLVVDGGAVVERRLEATRVAEQAARAGADELSVASVFSEGAVRVEPATAASVARRYLASAGHSGSVSVAADSVTVTVTGSYDTRFLSAVGITSLPIAESSTSSSVVGD